MGGRNAVADLIADKGWCVADGATGSNFFGRGLEAGYPPELWCLEKPEEVAALHDAFLDCRRRPDLDQQLWWQCTAAQAACLRASRRRTQYRRGSTRERGDSAPLCRHRSKNPGRGINRAHRGIVCAHGHARSQAGRRGFSVSKPRP